MWDEVGFRDGLCVRLAGNRGAGADALEELDVMAL